MTRKKPALLARADTGDPAAVERVLLEVVENQVRDGTPPATRATLERLITAGETREDALHLIACVLSAEMFEMLEEKRVFDAAGYTAMLDALPTLPYDADAL